MTNRAPGAPDSACDELNQNARVAEAVKGPEQGARSRKAYQRPVVEKRRSVRRATLVSGSSAAGVGSSTAP